MTFKNILPGLSRTKVIFQDFPGPGIFKKNPGLSRRHGNPTDNTNTHHTHTHHNGHVSAVPHILLPTALNNSPTSTQLHQVMGERQ